MTIEEEINKANAAFCSAIASGDANALRPSYSDNPWFMVPNEEPIKGLDAVVGAVQGLIDNGITGISLTTVEVNHLGDTAIEIGEYNLSAGDAVADRGKYMVVWKNIDGNWCIHRDMINTSLPAA